MNISYDRETGEVIDNKNLYLDVEKIAEEEKYEWLLFHCNKQTYDERY